jgi:cation:H+ antiporter
MHATLNALPTAAVIVVALVALVATLGASEVLVRGVGRLARNVGMLGGLVGLIVALCADAPEISSSGAAIANGSAATAAGVVFGSNIFNIAILLGGAALARGELRIHRAVVTLDAGVAIAVTLAVGGSAVGAIPVIMGWVLMLVVFVPYVLFLVLRPRTVARLPLPTRVHALLAKASSEAGMEGDELEAGLEEFGGAVAAPRSWRPVVLMAPSLAIIVLGATLVVQSSLVLGARWGIPTVLVGVTALAAATSLPNAYAAIRLAVDGHGAAVVSATFNSNTLNLIAGIAVPLLFVPGLGRAVPPGYIVWLLGMSVLAVVLVVRRLTRLGAVTLLVAYAAFVAYAVATA